MKTFAAIEGQFKKAVAAFRRLGKSAQEAKSSVDTFRHEWFCAGLRPDGSSLMKTTKVSIEARAPVRMRHNGTMREFSSIGQRNLVETITECTGCKGKPVKKIEGF